MTLLHDISHISEKIYECMWNVLYDTGLFHNFIVEHYDDYFCSVDCLIYGYYYKYQYIIMDGSYVL
jgi:hypothetical protein